LSVEATTRQDLYIPPFVDKRERTFAVVESDLCHYVLCTDFWRDEGEIFIFVLCALVDGEEEINENFPKGKRLVFRFEGLYFGFDGLLTQG